jgi:hypothetical protein
MVSVSKWIQPVKESITLSELNILADGYVHNHSLNGNIHMGEIFA